MMTLQYMLLACCVPTVFAYVCRLSLMSWRTTTPLVLLMHMSLSIATMWAGYWAWYGTADAGDLAAVIASACWIAISFRTWRHGVPDYFTRPADLDEADLHRVNGGKK